MGKLRYIQSVICISTHSIAVFSFEYYILHCRLLALFRDSPGRASTAVGWSYMKSKGFARVLPKLERPEHKQLKEEAATDETEIGSLLLLDRRNRQIV